MSRKLIVEIVGETSGLNRALNDATSHSSRFGSAMSKVGTAVKAGFLAATAGAVAVGVVLEKSVHAAMEAEQSQARLDRAFKNVGISAEAAAGQVAMATDAGRKLGFTDAETEQALGGLVTATGNVGKATSDLAVAQDLARFKGIGLGDATKMITMAMTGSQRASKQLGITVMPLTTTYDELKATMGKTIDATEKLTLAHAKLIDKQLTGQAVIDAVNAKVHGQGQTFADTAAGGIAQYHAQLDFLQVTIGNLLLPVLGRAATAVADFVAKLQGSKTAQEIFRTAFEGISTALGALVTFFENNWPKIKAAGKAVMDWYEKNLKPTMIAVANDISAAWASATDKMNRDTNRNLGSATNASGSFAKNVVANVNVVLAVLRGDWPAAWEQFKRATVAAMNTVGGAIIGFRDTARNAGLAIGKAIVDGVSSGLAALPGLIERGLSALGAVIRGWAGSAYAYAFKIGSSLLHGVLDGLGNLAGSLASKFVGAFHAGLGALKGAAGIKSPSTVMRDQVGKPLAAGVIQGWLQGAAGITPAMLGSIRTSMNAAAAAVARIQAQIDAATRARDDANNAKALHDAETALALAVKKHKGIAAAEYAVHQALEQIRDTARNRELVKAQGHYDRLKAQFDKAQAKMLAAQQAAQQVAADNLQKVRDKVGSAFGGVAGKILIAFDRQTQATLTKMQAALATKVGAAGDKFFQGGAKTPLEQKLADMQAADTLKGFTDSLAAAQASGDQAAIAQAQRALEEYQLGLEAAKERAQADKDYAVAVKALQDKEIQDENDYLDARALTRDKLEAALGSFGTLLGEGKVKLEDLNAVLTPFGLNIADAVGLLGFGGDGLTGAIAETKFQVDALGLAAQLAAEVLGKIKAPYGPPDSWMQNIPHLASGGNILGSGLAVVHKGETVVPAGGGGVNITVNAPNYVGSKREFADTIIAALKQYGTQNGGLRFA